MRCLICLLLLTACATAPDAQIYACQDQRAADRSTWRKAGSNSSAAAGDHQQCMKLAIDKYDPQNPDPEATSSCMRARGWILVPVNDCWR